MNKQLKILHIEDSPADAGLIERQLMKAGFDFVIRIIETKEDFIHSLDKFMPDLILSDHSLPQFNSMEALHIYNELNCEVPFILITGSVSEEFAIRSIKEGADDYILKNNLIRLPSAIRQAMKSRLVENEKRRANRLLEETNNELNTFIYKAAHDLRGPLCSIMGLANIAIMEGRKENMPDYIRKISESTKKLDDVLLSLIDLMSIKDAVPLLKEVDFNGIIHQIMEQLKPEEGFNDINFTVEIKGIAGFFSDEVIIRTFLNNIIENAIKYRCKIKAEVSICVLPLEEGIQIIVEDNGTGMDQNVLDHIFEMYYRGSMYSKGSGLGLYTAYKGVQKLGGTIEVKSVPAKGSVFTIILPNHSLLMQ